jgi:hypothetical protein
LCKGRSEVIPVHAMKAYKGSRGTAPFIVNLGAIWSHLHEPAILPPRSEPRCPLNIGGGGGRPKSRSRYIRVKKNHNPAANFTQLPVTKQELHVDLFGV